MVSTPVSMVGFGTGANKGEWLPGSCGQRFAGVGERPQRIADAMLTLVGELRD